jgi:hypothetical protein
MRTFLFAVVAIALSCVGYAQPSDDEATIDESTYAGLTIGMSYDDALAALNENFASETWAEHPTSVDLIGTKWMLPIIGTASDGDSIIPARGTLTFKKQSLTRIMLESWPLSREDKDLLWWVESVSYWMASTYSDAKLRVSERAIAKLKVGKSTPLVSAIERDEEGRATSKVLAELARVGGNAYTVRVIHDMP